MNEKSKYIFHCIKNCKKFLENLSYTDPLCFVIKLLSFSINTAKQGIQISRNISKETYTLPKLPIIPLNFRDFDYKTIETWLYKNLPNIRIDIITISFHNFQKSNLPIQDGLTGPIKVLCSHAPVSYLPQISFFLSNCPPPTFCHAFLFLAYEENIEKLVWLSST